MSTSKNDTSSTARHASLIFDIGAKGVDVSNDAALQEARTHMYEDVIAGLTKELEALRTASASGNHTSFVHTLLNVGANVDAFAHNLSALISVRAIFEYHRAGGKMPTTQAEALVLSAKLFAKVGDGSTFPDPAEVAAQSRAESSSVDGGPPLSVN